MQTSEEPQSGIDPSLLRDALMGSIAHRGRIGREQLLDMVFRAYDTALADLIGSGMVRVEPSPQRECHLDMFVAAKPVAR